MAIYQHALEPNMPPRNFFGSLGNTNLLRTHGTSPRSFLNFADDAKVPGGVSAGPFSYRIKIKKVGATVGTTAAPDKRRQLRGKRGDVLTASTTKTHRLQQRSRYRRIERKRATK
jgi:hypothetical protein